jgi:AcrR family transcriptional regulator
MNSQTQASRNTDRVKRSNHMDRRTRKTREAIIKAFIALMAEEDFEQITINEIAERADVNRGTVYLHFTDKFDLLDQCTEAYLAQLVDGCLQEDALNVPSKTAALQVLHHLEQNADFYRILLLNKGGSGFRKRLITLIQQIFARHIDAREIDGSINKEISVQFMTSAIVGVVEWWIMNAMPCTAEEVVGQLWLLLTGLYMEQNRLDNCAPTLMSVMSE